MNQPTSFLREKINSSSRLSVTSNSLKHNFSSSELKRKGNSLTKKSPQIEEICSSKQKVKYLIGWGQIPSLSEDGSKIQIINKDIIDFASGEDHLIFVDRRHKAFGIGRNQFGQLGNRDNTNNEDIIIPVFEGYSIKKVFSTQFSTFFLTQQNQLLGCGLNNRGQLGISYCSERENTPRLISCFSTQSADPELNRKNSRSKISSVYYNDLKKSISNEYSESQTAKTGRLIMEANQNIKDIRGGPFHTVLLTSKGRVYYSGNLYDKVSLLSDAATYSFIPISSPKLGKVISIRSYFTGFGMLTIENKLFLMGHFQSHIFDQPHLLHSMNVSSFDMNSTGIFIVDGFGEVVYFNTDCPSLKGCRINSTSKIRDIFCGSDYLLAISRDNLVFGLGDNSQNQLCSNKFRKCSELTHLGINLKEERNIQLQCSNNFALCLSNAPFSCEAELQPEVNNKLKDIERENKVLKELLCNKNKKNAKVQTEKQGKFQFSKSLNPRTFDNSMEIPFEEITLGKQISQGGYGIIYMATWRKSTVAVKLFKIDQGNDNSIRDFISECHAMEALRHPNIVMFLGACTKPPHFAIVLEYCEEGTLWSHLQKTSGDISWEERRRLALDVARGMNYLHERNTPILHRDLKSLNLLLDQSKRVKLADFGWTKSLQNYMTGKIGTYQWMAPEVISAFQYTEKADVYSFGIILWEIASREAPYRNIPGPQVAQDVLVKNIRPSIPKKTPESFVQLMQRCWQKDPSKRPSFNSIIVRLEQMKF